jgi:hypothetical protein
MSFNTCSQNSYLDWDFILNLFDLYSLLGAEVSENVCICALGGDGRKHLEPFWEVERGVGIEKN